MRPQAKRALPGPVALQRKPQPSETTVVVAAATAVVVIVDIVVDAAIIPGPARFASERASRAALPTARAVSLTLSLVDNGDRERLSRQSAPALIFRAGVGIVPFATPAKSSATVSRFPRRRKLPSPTSIRQKDRDIFAGVTARVIPPYRLSSKYDKLPRATVTYVKSSERSL